MPTFEYVKPTDEQKALMQVFRTMYQVLYDQADIAIDKPSRAKSLALTKLEESAMWINKAITENF